jgi:hypothetical protein
MAKRAKQSSPIGTVLTYAYGTATIAAFEGARRIDTYRPFEVSPREPWNAAIRESSMCLDHNDASPVTQTYPGIYRDLMMRNATDLGMGTRSPPPASCQKPLRDAPCLSTRASTCVVVSIGSLALARRGLVARAAVLRLDLVICISLMSTLAMDGGGVH